MYVLTKDQQSTQAAQVQIQDTEQSSTGLSLENLAINQCNIKTRVEIWQQPYPQCELSGLESDDHIYTDPQDQRSLYRS